MSRSWEKELEEEQRQREWEEEQRQREWEEEQRQREWEEEQRQLEINRTISIFWVDTGDSRLDDDYNLNTECAVIRNTGDWFVDTSGWKLYNKSYKRRKSEENIYYFPIGFVLGPGEAVFIYTGKFDWNLILGMEQKGLKASVYLLPENKSIAYLANEEGILYWILFWGKTEGEDAQVWVDLNDCAYLEDNQGNLIDERCW